MPAPAPNPAPCAERASPCTLHPMAPPTLSIYPPPYPVHPPPPNPVHIPPQPCPLVQSEPARPEQVQMYAVLKDDPDLAHVFEDVMKNGPSIMTK